MMLTLKPIKPCDIKIYRKYAEHDLLTFCKSTELHGLYDGETMVGFTGILKYRNKAIFKNHWVIPECRGKGYFKFMVQESIKLCGKTIIEATCTPKAIRYYLSLGFKPLTYYKNGCVKVRYENL